MTTQNTVSNFALKALDLVTALRKAPDYADEVLWVGLTEFKGATAVDRERFVLCDSMVQQEVRLMFPETGRGCFTRIRLSMPKEEVTIQNIDDVKVEMFLADELGDFLRCETLPLTGLPVQLRFAVEAEMFHRAVGSYSVRVGRTKETA
jgi:hypothetical protein